MNIDEINLNQLRVFESVYRTLNMTLASKELHLTQSGVSQHIKTLEDMLGLRLFDRFRKKLLPTKEADGFYEDCLKGLNQLEKALVTVRGSEARLSGTISIGLPVEFGKNVIIPLLSDFSKINPNIRFVIKYGFAYEMNRMLINGDLDFALVDEFSMDKSIKIEKVYDEILELYVHKDLVAGKKPKQNNNKEFFESFDYIAYDKNTPVIRKWMDYHYNIKNINLNNKVYVSDVQSVARFIMTKMGAGVLPRHHVSRLKEASRDLYCFIGKKKKLKNSISIAHVEGKSLSHASNNLMTFLSQKLSSK
ncbi:MAG: LysR family transcriptional regulator [Pseudomonadota bacterium]